MLVIIPIFAGLLACMPEYVPLGNPERARVDESMSGMWFVEDAEAAMDVLIGQIVFLQPWDKRTWLVTTVGIEDLNKIEFDELDNEYDTSTYQGFVDQFRVPELDEDNIELFMLPYKVWLAKLGGETFMTWEIRVIVDDPDELQEPWFWMDYRVTKRGEDEMILHLIDDDFPPLKEAPKTKRGWEKVVRKYADDDALYLEEPVVMRRVKEDDVELFVGLVNLAVMGDAM